MMQIFPSVAPVTLAAAGGSATAPIAAALPTGEALIAVDGAGYYVQVRSPGGGSKCTTII